jgi:hypothetical protein
LTITVSDARPRRRQAARRGPDERLNHVIHVVDDRHLVGDELDGEQHEQDADDPAVAEPLPTRRQVDQAVVRLRIPTRAAQCTR